MSIPSINENDILDFFEKTIADQIHLTTITSDRGETEGQDFGTDIKAATDWVLDCNRDKKNIYFTVNRVKPRVRKKPTKAQIIGIRFAHLDIDPPKDGSVWDKDEVYKRLRDAPVPPTLINWSGNGWHAFWRLNDCANSEDAECINSGLIQYFGGDAGTQNADRLLRVPGTINWPNKQKIEAGRTPQLAATKYRNEGEVTPLKRLVEAYPFINTKTSRTKERATIPLGHFYPRTAADLGLSEHDSLSLLINNPAGIDKSRDTLAFACEALRSGLPPEDIIGVLLNGKNAISAHCLSQSNPQRAAIRAVERAAGQGDVARRLRQRKEDQLIAEGHERRDVFPTTRMWSEAEMVDRFVFVCDGSVVVDRLAPRVALSLGDFRNQTAASQTMTVVPGKSGSKRHVKIPTATLWLHHSDRKEVQAITFNPDTGEFTFSPEGKAAINTWTSLKFPTPPENWMQLAAFFESHVRWLWGQDADVFFDWLGHLAQRPGELPSFGWLHISKAHGMGRNWIAGVLGRVFQGFTALGFDLSGMLNTGFNGTLGEKILVVVDEINEGASGKMYQNAQTLKRIITEETRVINPKYGRQRTEFNVCRWLILSNSSTALPLEDEDRRFWVVRCDDKPKEAEYYETLYTLKKDQAFIGSVAKWLTMRDLSGFNSGQRPPMTAAKKALLDRTRSEAEQLLMDIVANWPVDIITNKELNELLGDDMPKRHALRHLLDRAGIVKVGQWKSKTNYLFNGKITAYAVRRSEVWKDASATVLRTEIDRKSEIEKLSSIFDDQDK
jgi:hypothetical protein